VSDKAKAQNLAFPDDEGLVVRGQALMWTANGLFLAGALAAAGAATWWALLPPGESEP
jgi:hypothetical protein